MPRTYQALAKAATVLALLLGSNAGVAGTLFVGADTEEFRGLINGQDRIAKVTTTGATAGPEASGRISDSTPTG
jgi:hypothetical protein